MGSENNMTHLNFHFRGNLKTFMHVIHLLQSLNNLGPLPVADILTKLREVEGGKGPVSSLQGLFYVLTL